VSTGGSGSAGGSGGSGGQNTSTGVCTETQDRVAVSMTRDGRSNPESAFRDLTFAMAGEIVACNETTFSIEGCPEGSVCTTNEVVTFSITAPGLSLTRVLKAGALARVSLSQDCPWGCTTNIVLESVEALNGVSNPYPTGSGIYVAANDGGGTPSGVPYNVDEVRLDCANPYEGSGCGSNQQTGLYLLRFSSVASQDPVDVHMGESKWIRAGSGWLQVRNLRSFLTGWCDDYWNWSHWAIDGVPEY
jgi:hypothetical protein